MVKNDVAKLAFLMMAIALWGFSACTQGQQQGPEAKVTTAGTEATPPDVCEKPENIQNILCQWVSTEINVPSQNQAMKFIYDDKGQITQMDSYDQDGHRNSTATVVFNNYGPWKTTVYSDPQPPDSSNFTREVLKTVNYFDPDGLIAKTEVEEKNFNSQTQQWDLVSKRTSAYTSSQSPTLGIMTAVIDDKQNLIGGEYYLITVDPNSGNYLTVDKRTSSNPVMGGPVDSWEIYSYEYDSQSGRLNKLIQERQDCTQTTCDFNAGINSPTVETTEFSYDEKGRVSGTNQTITGGSSEPVDCSFNYTLDTKAPIAGKHPLEFFIMLFAPPEIKLGLNNNDVFSSWDCKSSSQGSTSYQFKWARLWEVLPEGQPPTD